MKTRKIFLNWERFSLKEYLRPTQCYRCCQFRHISKQCRTEEACGHCGEIGHTHKQCDNNIQRCINCAERNLNSEYQVDDNHSSFSKDCPSRQLELEELQKHINYG
ncbi:Hypothetical protein in type I retrotransposable element R1DM, partial [Stegodyphus mimosarum]